MASAHDTHHEGSHGSVKSHMIGFVLSIILTAIPFALAMTASLPKNLTVLIIVAMAVIQVVVHLVYFLHMNTSSEERWNLVALLFTAMIIGIVVVGSLWIMYNLNINMMVD